MDRLTLSEIAVLCEKDDEGGSSDAEIGVHLERLAGMTLTEQLWYEP